MDQVSIVCRRRHLSRRTEEAYRFWIRRYVHFHKPHHPRTVGPEGIVGFVNHLATAKHVAASTQSQALNALLFLYRDVFEVEIGHFSGLKRIQRRDRLPIVLTAHEVSAILRRMDGVTALMAHILYGSGLRVTECMTLRIKDVDMKAGMIHVRAGKGGKDRTTILPTRLQRPLQRHLLRVASRHRQDVARGAGFAPLPNALERKYPSASRSLAWQFVFPSRVLRRCPSTERWLRWHASESGVQMAFKTSPSGCAGHQAGVSPHTSPFVRDSPPSWRDRYPNDSAVAGSPQPQNDDDLHTCRAGCAQDHQSLGLSGLRLKPPKRTSNGCPLRVASTRREPANNRHCQCAYTA